MAATAEALQHTAIAAATTLLFGGGSPAEPAVLHTLQRLFPGSCYLALAVCGLMPSEASGGSGRNSLLLLSGNLLQSGGGQAAAGLEPAGAHTVHSSLVGAAMLAGRPQVFSFQGSMISSAGSSFAVWTDAAAAAERHGAVSFLCLPFKAALPGETGALAGGSGSQSGSLAAALLLGAPTEQAKPGQQQQQQQQQQVDGGGSTGGSSSSTSGSSSSAPPLARHLRSLVVLAAALARHAQHEMAQAAEALSVLRGARPTEDLQEEFESGTDADEAEEGEAADAAEGAAAAGTAAAAARAAGAAGVSTADVAAHNSAQLLNNSGDCIAAAASGQGSSAGSARCLAQQGSSSSSQPVSCTPPLVVDTSAAGGEAAAEAGFSASSAQAASPATAAAAASAEAADNPLHVQAGAAAAVGQPGTGEPAAEPAGAAEAREQQAGPACIPSRLRYLLLLCHAVLEQLMLLPSSRQGMQLDWLLRFKDVQPGGLPWQRCPPGSNPPAQQQQQGQQEGRQQGEAAALLDRQPWQLRTQLGPSLEQQFLQYHSRVMADKMDAAGSLILLSILVLLAKEPSSLVRLGHPLFWLVSGVLTLPLAALLPGPPGAWYVAQREQVLVVFFTAALLYQQATTNHLDLHVSRSSQLRYVNAGFAWLTVDGLLLQMRFCRQLPTLLTCFLLNLKVIPEVCRRYHAHMDPQRCAASGFIRGVLVLLIPLVVLYLLELRMRRNWLARRDLEAVEAEAEAAAAVEAEAERLMRQQRQQERRALARGARQRHGAGASGSGGSATAGEHSGASGSGPAGASG